MDNRVKCPKNEQIWLRACDKNGILKYIITSKIGARENYYIYECNGAEYKKLGKGRNPAELEKKYVKWRI